MPFLRFSLDKRGNETTSIVYQVRRHGKGHSRVLYWFRTPPNIKVGRAAIDEYAIRTLEESHPDLTFDWPRILHAGKTVVAPGMSLAGEGPKRSRAAAGGAKPAARQEASRAQPKPARETPEVTEPLHAPEHQAAADAVAGIISHDDVARLRGRYAEVLARISQQVGDPARTDGLRLEAEALNPDSWVTPEEVRKGVESFECVERRLRDLLGRRQRTRRGGARHRRRKGTVGVPATSTSHGPSTEAVCPDHKPDGGSRTPEQ